MLLAVTMDTHQNLLQEMPALTLMVRWNDLCAKKDFFYMGHMALFGDWLLGQ